MKNLRAIVMALVISAPYSTAAEKEIITTNWQGVGKYLAETPPGKHFRIILLDGRHFTASFVRFEEDGLVVGLNSATDTWAIGGGNAKIPSALVAALQREGKHGRGRLIGTLIGVAAASAALAAPPGKQMTTTPQGVEYKQANRAGQGIIAGVSLSLGYFFGRLADKSYPELRPRP